MLEKGPPCYSKVKIQGTVMKLKYTVAITLLSLSMAGNGTLLSAEAADKKPASKKAVTPQRAASMQPRWIVYDQWGNWYWQNKKPREAKEMWLQAMRDADQTLGDRTQRALPPATEYKVMQLVKHLMQLSGNKVESQNQGIPSGASMPGMVTKDPYEQRKVVDALRSGIKDREYDMQFLQKVYRFAKKTLGAENQIARRLYWQIHWLEDDMIEKQQRLSMIQQSYAGVSQPVKPIERNRQLDQSEKNPNQLGPNNGPKQQDSTRPPTSIDEMFQPNQPGVEKLPNNMPNNY